MRRGRLRVLVSLTVSGSSGGGGQGQAGAGVRVTAGWVPGVGGGNVWGLGRPPPLYPPLWLGEKAISMFSIFKTETYF